MAFHLSRKTRLIITICISLAFFLAEISVGFITGSLALIADAFHYLNDLISFVVALAALKVSEREKSPKSLTFGWQRASLLGAFFNGVFLMALGVSIILQSIERFISIKDVENPMLVLIIGCIGLFLNLVSALFLHEHDHGASPTSSIEIIAHDHGWQEDGIEMTRPHGDHLHRVDTKKTKGHDLGILGVLTHVLGDAVNNIGVIIAASVMWKAHYPGRFYADPGVGLAIGILILISSFPLVKRSGTILLNSVPAGVDISDVKHDLEKVPGVEAVHELHVWRLNQEKSVASAHIVVSESSIHSFMERARQIRECLHAYGIHSATLQPEKSTGPPEVAAATPASASTAMTVSGVKTRSESALRRIKCQIGCGPSCQELTCCD